jgi:hypothetical protein
MAQSSRRGIIPDDVKRRWKYNSLAKGSVWTCGYDLLPDDIIAKLAQCILNKPCVGRSKTPMNRYKEVCTTELNKWKVHKQPIPKDIAFRLRMKCATRDLERLQLTDAVADGLTSGDSTKQLIIPNQEPVELMEINQYHQEEDIPQASGEPSNHEVREDDAELSDGSWEDCADPFLPTEFSTLMQITPSIRYDKSGNEIDPFTGFPVPKITLKKVIGIWKRREIGMRNAPLTRLLKLLNHYKPEISKRDYLQRQLPKTCATLMKPTEVEPTFVIRDFDLYDYELDDFPEDAETSCCFESDSAEEDDEDSSSTDESDDQSSDDDTTGIEIVLEEVECVQEEVDVEDNSSDGNEGDDDEEIVTIKPATARHLISDVTEFTAEVAVLEVNRDLHKMVYFGLESILTCSNSSGNIQKGAYINFLRGIALLDEYALTDTLVNRLFPPNSKVGSVTLLL